MTENTIDILGVRIDNLSVGEIKEKISFFLENKPEQKFLITLNPEILLKAHSDEKYKKILNSADLNICDGFGLKLASFLRGKRTIARFAGADLANFMLKYANKYNLRVVIIATKDSLSAPSEIEAALQKNFPNLSAKSEYFTGSEVFFENGIIKSAEVVFVNFGAPEQEKFIYENRRNFPNAKVLIGVGGTFDFLTGKIRRAPRLMRLIGLEWLWRLLLEPKRFKRICNAVVLFPILSLTRKA